jgi:hypothetical protein
LIAKDELLDAVWNDCAVSDNSLTRSIALLLLDGAGVEQANLIDKAKWLNTLFLDVQLVTAIKRGAAKGDIRAVQMGYQRLGLMRDGEFPGEATPKPAPDARVTSEGLLKSTTQ